MLEMESRHQTLGDLVIDRDDDGRVFCSIPQRVSHYSAGGFDWGYIGPGAAELALNVLHHYLPPGCDREAPIKLERGEISAATWRLHRAFMAEFLIRLPYQGGCIHEGRIRRWIIEYFSDANRVPADEPAQHWWQKLVSRNS